MSIWLYEQIAIRIEGKIRVSLAYISPKLCASADKKQGFDEFMNLVIDDAIEVGQVTKTNDTETRRPLGMDAAGGGYTNG